jgi:cobalt-precorrin-5B (C1)-methyltransferase
MAPKRLRSGFTTGTAAAAATKAALQTLIAATPPRTVRIDFLSEGSVEIPVHFIRRLNDTVALATVIKDAGDDPDITHRAEIGSRVTLAWRPTDAPAAPTIQIRGGKGVGRVTKPGLEIPPGNAAINTGPQRMIRQAVRQVLDKTNTPATVEVEIFVPEGERLARKTLNARLGIMGGLSILGTTGIVKPLSHEAYTATIRAALSVARASGGDRVVLTTGRRSERFSQQLFSDWPPEQFIQIGDYFKFAMENAAASGFRQIVLAVFFGKAVKMAMGIPHTHAAKAELVLDRLAVWAAKETGRSRLAANVRRANTARHAFELLRESHPEVVARVGRAVVEQAALFAGGRPAVRTIIFDYQGAVAYDSAHAR